MKVNRLLIAFAGRCLVIHGGVGVHEPLGKIFEIWCRKFLFFIKMETGNGQGFDLAMCSVSGGRAESPVFSSGSLSRTKKLLTFRFN